MFRVCGASPPHAYAPSEYRPNSLISRNSAGLVRVVCGLRRGVRARFNRNATDAT